MNKSRKNSIHIIENWKKEVRDRPNYQLKVDPKKIKLKEIVFPYFTNTAQQCGLKDCGRFHNRGYIVETDCGTEMNLGNVCGSKYFGADFKHITSAFSRKMNAMYYREELLERKLQLVVLRKQVQDLKKGDHNGDWCYENMHMHISRLLPQSIEESLVRRAKRGSGIVVRDVRLTGKDKAIAEQAGNKDGFKSETIFTINGVTSVISYKRLRKIINVYLGEKLEEFSELNIESADFDTLRKWANWSNKINERLIEAKKLIQECNRFLMPANIENIRKYQGYL